MVVPNSKLEPFARAEDPLAKLRLLRGMKVEAIRGSTGLAIFRQGLLRAGLDEKALELREFSRAPEIISSLVAGHLEAGLLWSPYMTLAEDRDLGIALWMSDILQDHVCCRQIARDDFLQNMDATVEYLVGILKADMLLRRSRSDPKLRSKLMADVRCYLTTLTVKQLQLESFGEDPRTTISPDLDREGIEDYLKAMETAGLMRGDQCANVREKIRPDFMQAAYRRLGCKEAIARNCVDKRAAVRVREPPVRRRPIVAHALYADPCGRLAACAAVLVISLALVETLVPNAPAPLLRGSHVAGTRPEGEARPLARAAGVGSLGNIGAAGRRRVLGGLRLFISRPAVRRRGPVRVLHGLGRPESPTPAGSRSAARRVQTGAGLPPEFRGHVEVRRG